MHRPFLAAVAALLAFTPCCLAGVVYRITSTDGKNTSTYDVKFGGGRKFDMVTAFDPATKKFVYMQWNRGTPKPAPAGSIWDYRTGETIVLYAFPGVAQPLPVIPSIDDLKICPLTGNKKLSKEKRIIYD